MPTDPFQSHTFSLVLAWMAAAPTIFSVPVRIWVGLADAKGAQLAFSLWLVVCAIIFSPLRYMLFLIVLGTAYPFQSFTALLTVIPMMLFLPFVIIPLTLATLVLPLLVAMPILGQSSPPTAGRIWAAAAALPITCMLGSAIFFFALPYAAKPVHWLRGDDVIRATNGPGCFVFKYITCIGSNPRVPWFYSLTPQTPKDLVRCHVAGIFLDSDDLQKFVAQQYPEIYSQALKMLESGNAAPSGSMATP